MIQFDCSCGKVLRVKDELAGRRVKCPQCQGVLTVPAGDEADDTPPARSPGVVRFSCECGKEMSAKSDLAGKRTKCPGCGEVLTIPAADETSASKGITEKPRRADIGAAKTASTSVEDDNPFADEPVTPTIRGKKRKLEADEAEEEQEEDEVPRKRKKVAKKNNALILWSAVIAGVLLIGGGVTAFFLWPKGDTTKSVASKDKDNKDNKDNKDGKGDGGRTGAAGSFAELDLVPGNALGFASIRVADWWNSAQGKEVQSTVKKMFRIDVSALLEAQIGLKPEDIERVSVVFPSQDPKLAWGVAAASKPFDQKKLVGVILPQGRQMSAGGKTYHASADIALYFPDDKTLIAGTPAAVQQIIQQGTSSTKKGSATEAVQLASAGKHLLVGGFFPPAGMLGNLKNSLPPNTPMRDLILPLLDMEHAIVSANFGTEVEMDFRVKFPNEDKATKAKTSILALVKIGREQLTQFKQTLPPGPMNAQVQTLFSQIDETLRDLPVKQQGAGIEIPLRLKGEIANSSALTALLIPAVQKVREASQRVQVSTNLRQIGIAFHDHNAATQALPAAEFGKGLSWRVALLPYLGEDELYKQFHLDEAWNSPHNMTLLNKMPKVYQDPDARPDPTNTKTYYQVFTGPNTPFNGKIAPRIPQSFTDGTSNTLLVVESRTPVEWTKPEDIPYDPGKPVPRLGVKPGSFAAVMADGRALKVSTQGLSDQTLRAAITPAAGDVLGADWQPAR